MAQVNRHLLLLYAGHAGGRTHEMVAHVREGIARSADEIELRALPALEAGADDLLWANGVLIGTPEHFGYMAGAI
jgi:NAD(P)H-dependent FMN reductase